MISRRVDILSASFLCLPALSDVWEVQLRFSHLFEDGGRRLVFFLFLELPVFTHYAFLKIALIFTYIW